MSINRNTNGVALPDNVASGIWADAREQSAVMSLATEMPLAGSGVTVPMITGDAEASWVDEGDEKPVSDGSVDNKVIRPYKLSVIQTFSDEFRRDATAMYNALAQRLPDALARKFDETVFHGTAPGTGFDVLTGSSALGLDAASAYADLVAIDGAVAEANGDLTGFVLAPRAKGVLLNAVDGNDRPLFLNNLQTEGGVNSLLGAQAVTSKHAYKADEEGDDGEVLGFAGDWTSAYYGTVEGIKVSMTDQATLTVGGNPVNLWQRNMFAIRAEVEVAFAVRNGDHFVKIVGSNTVA